MQGVRFDRPLVVLRRPHRRKQPVTADGFGVDIAADEIIFELLPAGQPRAGVVEDHAHAVKDQLVLTADQVVVAEDDAVVAGPRGQHLCPFAPLPGVVRGAVDVDDHERPAAASAWQEPPGAQISSQIVTPTGTPSMMKTGARRPGWKYRFSSNTP